MRLNRIGLFRQAAGIALIMAAFFAPSFPAAQPSVKVLIYYNSNAANMSQEPMTVVRDIIAASGTQVTTIDVTSGSYCPGSDDWGSYSQVWDLRAKDPSVVSCPPAGLDTDSFTDCWQTQSVSYLQSGGNLFLIGEFYPYNRRNIGISDFLIAIGAVKAGYTDCPGLDGNGYDMSGALLPGNIPGQSGPVSFAGAAMGGIPIQYLNGSNFVSDPYASNWDDDVDRSIVSGWQGGAGQMANLTGTVGNLVTVWDTNCFQFASLPPNIRAENAKFINSVYCFLGGGACSSVTPTPTLSPTSSPTMTDTASPTETPTETVSASLTDTPTDTLTGTPSPTPTASWTHTQTVPASPTDTTTDTPTPTSTDTPTTSPTSSPTVTDTASLTDMPAITASPTPDFSLRIWPNPFVPAQAVRGTLKCFFMPEGSSLAVYTVSGEKVFEAAEEGNRVEWDGRNAKKVLAARGAYYCIVRKGKEILKQVVVIHH